MKIIEYYAIATFTLGFIFTLLNWPGHALLVVLSLTILSYYYFIFSFAIFNNVKTKNILKKGSYKNITALQIVFSLLLGMSLSLVVNGIMFQIQKWTSEISILIIGLISTLVMLILYYAFLKKHTKNWKAVYLRSSVIIFIGFIIYLVF